MVKFKFTLGVDDTTSMRGEIEGKTVLDVVTTFAETYGACVAVKLGVSDIKAKAEEIKQNVIKKICFWR